jgi:hypothetical protein
VIAQRLDRQPVVLDARCTASVEIVRDLLVFLQRLFPAVAIDADENAF